MIAANEDNEGLLIACAQAMSNSVSSSTAGRYGVPGREGRDSMSSAHELMQNRLPVGRGPSRNTWQRCEPHCRHRTSVRMPRNPKSLCSVTASATAG